MAETTVVTKAYYKANIKPKVGSLMFPGEYYDITRFVNFKKPICSLTKNQIFAIFVTTDRHPAFKNITNSLIPYEFPMLAISSADGAFEDQGMFYVSFPVGDVYIVSK